MTDLAHLPIPEHGKLAANITHFARALRLAGLRAGPGQVIGAIRAVEAAGFTRREDFYWALHSVFVARPEERAVFAQVFRLFWRDPRYLEHMMAMMLPALQGAQQERRAEAAARRAAEALLDAAAPPPQPHMDDEGETEIEIDASATASGEERLRTLDFEQMSADELGQARRMLARLALPVRPLPSRRHQPDPWGPRPDWRATMRRALRQGGEIQAPSRRAPHDRWPTLVAICDISGSMSVYSRMVLHFVHALSNARGQGWARVHAFTFGTRLTNITRHLRQRDVDAALAAAGAEAQDWQGGTRIGACLHEFNRDWSRRVMGGGALVLLISDGLDRDGGTGLSGEVERLRLSARRLIWVNPLLRFGGFLPQAQGIRAMLPEVDAFIAGHSIAALEELGQTLSQARGCGERDRLLRLLADSRPGGRPMSA